VRNTLGGGNWQSSIVYAPKDPSIVATFVSKGGEALGYRDGEVGAGAWHYTGQGTAGHQSFDGPRGAANRALRDSAYVLLFAEAKKGGSEKSFVGVFQYDSWDWYTPDFGPRSGDKLIQFTLKPVVG
jgi:hypothetical protein